MICNRCKKDYPKSSFGKVKVKERFYLRKQCVNCMKDLKNKRYKENRLWLIEYKKKQKCRKCGTKDFRVLEFHHKNDDKFMNVSEMMYFSKEKIMKELKKCDVLCANCHRMKHYNEFMLALA